jgi:ABC-type multidrug transport system permease subunit
MIGKPLGQETSMILAALSPIIVPLWVITSGLFCGSIGRKTESARSGWFFFLIVGLLPLGAMFAFVGVIAAAVVVAVVSALILILVFLDWYSERS